MITIFLFFNTFFSTSLGALEINVGDPIHLKIPSDELKDVPEKVICEKHQIPFYKTEKFIHFFYAESYFSSKKSSKCELISKKDEILKEIKFEIKIPDFPQEKLKVKPGKVNLNSKDLKRALKEKEEKNLLYKNPNPTPFFSTPFALPLDSVVTSIYGTQRIFNKSKESQHLGTDLRAPVGTEIRASNRGKVILAEDYFFEGKVVVLDHGLGIFSVYAHLSDIRVKSGDIVEQGDVLALSGATGRVSGPHLHWGMKIHDNWVDAQKFVGLGGITDELKALP